MGPTAAGKTEWGLAVARRLGGEIVNADAFQFYRGMDIGTAKPSPAQRADVPHHLVDVLDPAEPATVAWFQDAARAAVGDIVSRGRVPVVVGGSSLYVRALCDELDIPPNDPEVRRGLQERAERLGGAALHDELQRRDPEAARHIDPRNVRRVVRALEVVELRGSFTARLPEPVAWMPTLWLAPHWDRADLDARIERRTHAMWEAGFPEEVARLAAGGLEHAPTAARAVGYPQALAQLRGELTQEDAIAATSAATRRLARRQERTFRADSRVHWLDPAGDPAVPATAFLT